MGFKMKDLYMTMHIFFNELQNYHKIILTIYSQSPVTICFIKQLHDVDTGNKKNQYNISQLNWKILMKL